MGQIVRAFVFGIAAALLVSGPASADSSVDLACAGRYRPVTDTKIELHDHAPHVVNVSFGDPLPPKATLDWVLRDCLRTAIKLDGKRDIIVRAWHYEDGAKAPKELELYPGQQKLVYRASRRKVMLADPGALAERKP